MLKPKQAEKFNIDCAKWLERYLKSKGFIPIKDAYAAGKEEDYTREQIKAARSWHGKHIKTVDGDTWEWDFDE